MSCIYNTICKLNLKIWNVYNEILEINFTHGILYCWYFLDAFLDVFLYVKQG